jgi:hypothetical protein
MLALPDAITQTRGKREAQADGPLWSTALGLDRGVGDLLGANARSMLYDAAGARGLIFADEPTASPASPPRRAKTSAG